ncbi:MAG: alpha/beta hydrolase-fold protein [bacterium]
MPRFICLSLLGLLCLLNPAHADWAYREPQEIDALAGDALVALENQRAGWVLEGLNLEAEGQLAEAAACYIAALQPDSANFEVLLRLAGCYGQLGEASLAAEALRLAQEAGLRNISHRLDDPRFDMVREDYSFRLAADVLRSREARYHEQMGESLLVPMGAMGSVRYFLPDDYDAQRSYTLVVMLHGATGTPENVAAWGMQMPHREFILAAPAAPYPVFSDHQDSRIWWPGGIEDGLRMSYLEQCADYVGQVVESMRGRYSIGRVVLGGFSQGGMLASYCALTRPGAYDALGCFSTTLYVTDELPRRELDFPVFSGHGLRDTAVRPEQSELLADFLEEQGCSVTRFSFDGGHEISVQELEAFCDWLDALNAEPAGNIAVASDV